MTVVRNEFEAGENSPFNVLGERMAASAYLWHNYGHAIIGARSDIENVPIERLQAFYRKYYQPDNAVLLVSGRFDEAATLAMIERHFGNLPKPARVLIPTYTVEPTQDGERSVTLRRAGESQLVGALYHLPPGSHADFPAIDILVTALTKVPGGRLHRALVQIRKGEQHLRRRPTAARSRLRLFRRQPAAGAVPGRGARSLDRDARGHCRKADHRR